MFRAPALLLALALGCASCFQLKMTAQGGYAKLGVDGDIALSNTTGGSIIDQDFESAFGLGEDQGSPYLRLQLDLGVPVLTVSGVTFEERGRGTVNATFGNISAGTPVDSLLEFSNVKASYAFQIDLGPVAVAPGIAVDLFDLKMNVRDTFGIAEEDIDVLAPIPMAFVRGEVDLAWVAAVAELGYMKVPEIDGIEGQFFDAELLAEVRPTPLVHLFAGYRLMHLDGEGTVDDEDFAADFNISGWVIGGGVRF
ncbi:MAG: hypothetical protein AB7O97_18475 [Planctomycetota bacterium]